MSGQKVLRGDRNQCQGCKEYFNSTFAFEKHRTGEFGKDRRCRTEQEMRSIGMATNADGFWVGRQMDGNTLSNLTGDATSDLNDEGADIPVPPALTPKNTAGDAA